MWPFITHKPVVVAIAGIPMVREKERASADAAALVSLCGGFCAGTGAHDYPRTHWSRNVSSALFVGMAHLFSPLPCCLLIMFAPMRFHAAPLRFCLHCC
jgi:hypothetical protein